MGLHARTPVDETDHLGPDDILTLARHAGGHHVSIYLPTHPAADPKEDLLRFKGLLHEAQERSAGAGGRDLLRAGHDLLQEEWFWRHRKTGLAAFFAPGWTRFCRLPLDLAPLVFTGSRFLIRPLLPLLDGDGPYLVLALSHARVRLFEGSRDAFRERDELALTPETALLYDGFQKRREYHVAGHPGTSGSVIMHAQGIGAEIKKQHVRDYFLEVDRALARVTGDGAPLVLAGVEYLHPIFRAVSSYPNVAPDGVTGNTDLMPAAELHARSWQIAQPIVSSARSRRLRELRAVSERRAEDLGPVLRAAEAGRVDTLFADTDQLRWGPPRFGRDPIDVHAEPEPGDEDLVDLAAVTTMLAGGTVFGLHHDEMPVDAPVAAILRY